MLLNKIKFNYYAKIFDDLFAKKNYEEATELLIKNINNKSLYFPILKYINDKYLTHYSHNQFYKKKLFWLIGFDRQDNLYVENFLKFYFSKLNVNNIAPITYRDFLNKSLMSFVEKNNLSKITFEQIVQDSNLYQTGALMNSAEDNFILFSSSVFFEAPNNKYFIYPQTTKSYIYLIRNPLQIYLRNKMINNNSQESLNIISQADQNFYSETNLSDSNFYIPENKQSWNVNVKSWVDENVKSTYRGKIIKFEDLRSSTPDTLAEILFHYKQAGLNFDLNYDLIEEFISSNSIENDKEEDLSRKETKIILNNIDKSLLEEFEYQV